ncbi:hypothetical protein C8T65DRAFT_739189 [Cerioporus squamosus]|nr:hypothetical protein C8T65DRAFT_739189 [Cerioporus squamosus]
MPPSGRYDHTESSSIKIPLFVFKGTSFDRTTRISGKREPASETADVSVDELQLSLVRLCTHAKVSSALLSTLGTTPLRPLDRLPRPLTRLRLRLPLPLYTGIVVVATGTPLRIATGKRARQTLFRTASMSFIPEDAKNLTSHFL